jgi:hypothetical protein
MSLIPAIHSWNLTNYARRLNTNPLLRNEYFWSCLNANQTSLKMMITPALQLMILSSDQCIEELIGNGNVIICLEKRRFYIAKLSYCRLGHAMSNQFNLIKYAIVRKNERQEKTHGYIR